jgi:hypothetical protein
MEQQVQNELRQPFLDGSRLDQRGRHASEPVEVGQTMETRELRSAQEEPSEEPADESSEPEHSECSMQALWPPWTPLTAASILTVVLLSLVTAFVYLRLPGSEVRVPHLIARRSDL